MIFKGSIIDIKTNYAIVITDKAEFYKVKKKDGLLINKQIIFIEDDLYKEKNIRVTRVIKYAAVIMLLLVSTLFLTRFITFNKISYIPMATISVDINPSIELEINKDYKVINISSINSEGNFIADKNMIGNEIEEALYTMLINAVSENYITKEKNSVLIGIGKTNNDFQVNFDNFVRNLNNRLKNNNELEYVNILLLQGDYQKLELSRQNDLTIGKYLLYLKVNSEGSDLKLNDVREMTTQELIIYSNQSRNRYHESESEEPIADYDIVKPENNVINPYQNQNRNSEPVTNNNNNNNNAAAANTNTNTNTDADTNTNTNTNTNADTNADTDATTEDGYENKGSTVKEQENTNNSEEPGQINSSEVNKGSLNNNMLQEYKSIFENNINIPTDKQKEIQDREIPSKDSKYKRGKLK